MRLKKTLIVFIPGYKPNKNITAVVKAINSNLKYKLCIIDYKNKPGNNYFDIAKIINKTLFKLDVLLKNNNFNKVILVGYSLGAAIALEIARNNLFNKLILISVFDDRKNLLRKRNINITNKENISPVKTIKEINIPVVFIHGTKDLSIDIKRSKKVFLKSNKKSTFLKINTDHYFRQKTEKEQLYNHLLDQLQ